jgi:rapamycin-insensitive companion of mTOR
VDGGEEEEEKEGGEEGSDSSGDEQRTERQRSVSDPADIKRRGMTMGFGR